MSLALTIAKSNNLTFNIELNKYKYKLNKDNNKKFENIKKKSIFQKLKMIRITN